MIKSEYAIQMDFQKTVRQAEHLEDIAGKIDQVAKRDLESCMNSISRDWISDNSKKYCKKGREVASQLQTLANGIKNSAVTIKTIAKNTYNAEMRARELALERK